MPTMLENMIAAARLASVAVTSDAALLDAILSFAAVVVVPLAFKLTQDRASGRQTAILIAAAVLLSSALLLPGGAWPAAMAVPWLLITANLLMRAVLRAYFLRSPNLETVTALVAHLFLAIGAVWALLACGGWSVLGFDPVIVQLTAIHFHYAGFALTTLAVKAAETYTGRVVNDSLLLVLLGVPAVAAGIAARSASAQVEATVILTAGCILVAGIQFRAAFAFRRPIVRTLLAVSAMSLLSGMALAAVYVVGQLMGRDWIDIPTMVKSHGIVNAFGFAFCGLLAHCLAPRAPETDCSNGVTS